MSESVRSGSVREPGPIPIVIVMRTFEPGGTEGQMIELVRRLDPARWRVHVACFRAQGRWIDRVAETAASIAEFPVRSLLGVETVRHVRAFVRWCRAERVAIVQATGMPSNLFALPAAALAGVPVRIGARRDVNPNKTGRQLAAQRAAYSCATVIVANSSAAAARLRRERVPQRKIAVVPNGLASERFSCRPSRATIRTVIVVANLRSEKRHDVLIDAAGPVLARFPDARFQIVGDGPERDRLEARAAARGVSGAVAFVGHQKEVPRWLAGADIFVLPSQSEAFPNAVVEAMAAGLPVVASNLDALRELVDQGRTGLLFPSGDSRALADALCRLMANPAMAAEMGAQGRHQAATRYSFDRMVATFELLYLSQLGRRMQTSDRVSAPQPRTPVGFGA